MATDWRASPAADRDRLLRLGSPCSLYRPKILYPVLREMPKSRHTWVIGSPSKRRATNRRRSSMTELSFHGIHTLRKKAESVTHVSGTGCHLCLGSLMQGRSLKVKGVSGCAQIRNANPFEKR